MTTQASKAQVESDARLAESLADARLAESLAKCARAARAAAGKLRLVGHMPADQGHLRAVAARDVFYAREDAIPAPHAEWEA